MSDVYGQITPALGVPKGSTPFKAVATIGTLAGTAVATVAAPAAGKKLYVTDIIITNQATQNATISIQEGTAAVDIVPFIVGSVSTTKLAFVQAREYATIITALTTSILGGSAVVSVNGGQY